MIRLVALTVFLASTSTRGFTAQGLPPEVHFRARAIWLYGHRIEAEIAETPDGLERGLMMRTELKDGHGMLFIFDREETLRFWMKGTLIPLSIGYFSAAKKLLDVREMEPAAAGDLHPPSYDSAKPAQYALEMPKGWFAKNKIPLGAKLVFPSATKTK